MTDAEGREQLRAAVRERLGAIMLNPLRKQGLTCAVCLAPRGRRGYDTCHECGEHRRKPWTLADRVVPLTYSVKGRQSNLDMHHYKHPMSPERRRASDAWQRLSLLVAGFALWHARCLELIAREPVSGLVTVPSLGGRPGVHPLNGLAEYLPRAWHRLRLLPGIDAERAERRRLLDPAHFVVPDSDMLVGRHVVARRTPG